MSATSAREPHAQHPAPLRGRRRPIERAAAPPGTAGTGGTAVALRTAGTLADAEAALLAALAHRLRTTMALVFGEVELLREEVDLPADPLTSILVHRTRLRNEIESALEVALWPPLGPCSAGPEPKGSAPERNPTGEAAVADVRAHLEAAAHATGRDLRTEDDGAAFRLEGDRDRLGWSLREAWRWAAERSAPGEPVDLRLNATAAGAVQVELAITGPPARVTADPLDDARLALLRAIAEAHGGTLAVEGRSAADNGPCLRLVLPGAVGSSAHRAARSPVSSPTPPELAPASHQPEAPTPSARPSDVAAPGRPLVLVVEDDAALRALLSRILGGDHRVVAVGSGEAALAVTAELRPDLILCDLVLPGLDGEDFVHALQGVASLRDVPLIVVSARTDEELRVRLLRTGVADFVHKPFQPDELRARVANVLAGRLAIEDLQLRADDAQRLADQLQHALDSRVLIEQAKGMVAGQLGITLDEAFGRLRGYARSHNHKLHDVARAVAHGGFRLSR